MKKSIRILAVLLILTLLCSILFACKERKEEQTTETGDTETLLQSQSSESESETEKADFEFKPDIPEKNYDTEFIMSIMFHSNQMDYHWVEDSKGDAMSESIYARQEAIRNHIGVEVIGKPSNSDETVYTAEYKTAIKNKDDSIHTIVTHVYLGVVGLISENYLQDLAQLEGLNLEADYWTMDMMENIAIGDRMYLGNNKFNILYTQVLAFNKTMMEQYEDDLGTTVYELVDSYKWTLDQMISLAQKVSIDTTSNGKTDDDTYGLTSTERIAVCGFLESSDIQLVDMNEKGGYELSFYTEVNAEKTYTLIEKLSALTDSANSWLKVSHDAFTPIGLETGRALMAIQRTNQLPNYCNFEGLSFGVLPFPMYDEAQKDVGYRHLQWGGYLTVPSYLANPAMVADTVELLAYYSYDVNNTFYEKLIGKQAADAPDDRRMLELIWDTICGDFGQTYADCGSVLYMVPDLLSTEQELSSYYSAKSRVINKTIEKFIKTVNKNK